MTLFLNILLFIFIFIFVYHFIKKYVIHRRYSNLNGIKHLIHIFHTHSIPIVFILMENINPNNKHINFIKRSFKNDNLLYFSLNNNSELYNYYKIYVQLINNVFVIITHSISSHTIESILNQNLNKNNNQNNKLIINFYNKTYNNRISSKKIKYIECCNGVNLINKIRYAISLASYNFINKTHNTNTIVIVNITEELLYNDMEYAYTENLIEKKQISDISINNYKNIIIPKEFFMINNAKQYINLKSIHEHIYLYKYVNLITKIKKTVKLNNLFTGINDTHDFTPLKKKKLYNYEDNSVLNRILNDNKKLYVIIGKESLISRDTACILYDINHLFKINVYYKKYDKDTSYKINYTNDNNYILLNYCYDNTSENSSNIYIINKNNIQQCLLYIYSRLYEININSLKKNKFFYKCCDLLIINHNSINKNIIYDFALNNIFWCENVYYTNVDIINYLKLINCIYKNITIHIVLDNVSYNNHKMFLMLKKNNINFIAYVDKEFIYNKFIDDLGFNILNLTDKKICSDDFKKIANETRKSIIVFKKQS